MGIECDLREYLGVPEDTSFIRHPEGSIGGIIVRDGSLDYSDKGQKFLQPDFFSVSRAGITTCGILIE